MQERGGPLMIALTRVEFPMVKTDLIQLHDAEFLRMVVTSSLPGRADGARVKRLKNPLFGQSLSSHDLGKMNEVLSRPINGWECPNDRLIICSRSYDAASIRTE